MLDGSTATSPVLTNGNIVADYGGTPKPPEGMFNKLIEPWFAFDRTRFGPPEVNRAKVPADRFSFYENGTAARQAGIAAARYLFVLPEQTPEEDPTDENILSQQSISVAVTEAYQSRDDAAVTLLIATVTELATSGAYSHANIYTRISGRQGWTFQGAAEPEAVFELPADGNTYQVEARPVLTNGAEQTTGVVQTALVTAQLNVV